MNNNTDEENPKENSETNEQNEQKEQTTTSSESHETIQKETEKKEIEEEEETKEKMSAKHARGSGDNIDDYLENTKKLRNEILKILNSQKFSVDVKSSLLEETFLRHQKEIKLKIEQSINERFKRRYPNLLRGGGHSDDEQAMTAVKTKQMNIEFEFP